MNAVTIRLLADRPDTIPELVMLFESTWGPYYADGPGDARADLEARLNRDRLPAGFVALEHGKVIGSAAIGLDVTTGLEPSVIGLVVAPGHRGKGTAGHLIAACESLATDLGYARLHTSSSVLNSMLSRRKWIRGEPVKFLDGTAGSIYSKALM